MLALSLLCPGDTEGASAEGTSHAWLMVDILSITSPKLLPQNSRKVRWDSRVNFIMTTVYSFTNLLTSETPPPPTHTHLLNSETL